MDLDLHYFMDSYTAIIEVCPILSFIGRKIKKVNAWMCDREKVLIALLKIQQRLLFFYCLKIQ